MNCARCGKPVTSGNRFCANCGFEVTDPGGMTALVGAEGGARPSGGARVSRTTPEAMAAMATAEDEALFQQLKKELVADYELEKELGRGGMAVVYKAVERDLQRPVALKVLPPGTGGQMAERFKREARMAAQLGHPNIIPVYRVGQVAGTHFFAMKFVEGRALDAIIEQQGALPVPVILAVLRGAVAGLAFAHEKNVIHRDIKGANILIERDGHVLLSDLGIARAAEDKTLTATGSVIGTPHFMSPEQCGGQKVAPQSDQYSMGIVAFQMLTGAVPFDSETLMGILQHHFFTPVPDVKAVREGVPPQLLQVVYKALAKDPANRYPTTRDMLKGVEAVPFTDADRASAEETLRQLAVGTAVPKVRTGSLPPLTSGGLPRAVDATAPTLQAPAPRPGTMARKPAAKKSRLPLVLGTVVVLGGGGAAAALLLKPDGGATTGTRTQGDTGQVTIAPQGFVGGDTAKAPDSARAVPPVDSTPPPTTPSDRGTIRLTGLPSGARVAIDGRAARAPYRVTAGVHRIEVTATGYETFADTVRVAAGRTEAVRVAMARTPGGDPGGGDPGATGGGLLRITTSPPDANILLNGRVIGQGGMSDHPIPAGRVRFSVTAPGHVRWDTTVTVQAGGTVNLRRVTLRPEGTP